MSTNNKQLSDLSENLEISGETFRALALSSLDKITEFIDELPDRTIYQKPPTDGAFPGLSEPIPEKAIAFDQLLDYIFASSAESVGTSGG